MTALSVFVCVHLWPFIRVYPCSSVAFICAFTLCSHDGACGVLQAAIASAPGVVFAFGVALELRGVEVHLAQVAGGVAGRLVVEVLRLGVAALAAGRDGARAVSAGGESGDPKSKHFNDQAPRYAAGNLREVYFYPAQLKGHTEREYHPGR